MIFFFFALNTGVAVQKLKVGTAFPYNKKGKPFYNIIFNKDY